jgi:hypothetical protein
MRRAKQAVIGLLLAMVVLAGCHADKGDPVKISQQFMLASWQGDVVQAKALSCKQFRPTAETWAQSGDSTLTIDTNHLEFTVVAETDKAVQIAMSGLVTFKSAAGQTEVRNLDEQGITYFTLVDEDGWKVCDVH